MINLSFDMETADPDDVLTLCLLSHHPKVNLVSTTITPGLFIKWDWSSMFFHYWAKTFQ